MNKVIVILGPTASGKTDVAVELSKMIECEVVSADSRQIYRYLDIGTAKPTKAEQSLVKHHFIDFLNPDEYYSAGLFGNQADEKINGIILNSKLPLVVGGSGLYIKALCEGLFKEDLINNFNEIRSELTKRIEEEGIDSLYNELLNIDKDSAALYKDKNPRRIIRALEYFYTTGMPLSKAHIEKREVKKFKTLYFGIQFEREELYKRINNRAELMWENGLEKETKNILEMGFSSDLNSLNTVGYKECVSYFKRDISKERAVELTKQNTRRYAKRQMTWFRKNKEIIWIEGGNNKNIAEQIIYLSKKIIPDL